MLTSICRSIVTICSGLYLLIGMTRFSSKWILSHSTWYKFRRSGQPVSELFAGLSDSVAKDTHGQMRKLSTRFRDKSTVSRDDGNVMQKFLWVSQRLLE